MVYAVLNHTCSDKIQANTTDMNRPTSARLPLSTSKIKKNPVATKHIPRRYVDSQARVILSAFIGSSFPTGTEDIDTVPELEKRTLELSTPPL